MSQYRSMLSAISSSNKKADADKHSGQTEYYSTDSGFCGSFTGTDSLRSGTEGDEELRTRLGAVSVTEEGNYKSELCDPRSSSCDREPDVSPIDTDDFFVQDADGDTQLHIAVILSNDVAVEHIISSAPSRVHLNYYNDLHQTPLHLAICTKQPQVVRRLLAAGADPLARDWRGNTAAHLACRDGELQCLRELANISSAAPRSFDVHNYDGQGPLHIAAANGHIDAIEFAVKRGVADVDFQEAKGGRTLLHFAAECGNELLLERVLTLGADVDARTYGGARPITLARAWRRHRAVNVLALHGAELPSSASSSENDDTSDADDDEMDSSTTQEYDDFQINGLPVMVGVQ